MKTILISSIILCLITNVAFSVERIDPYDVQYMRKMDASETKLRRDAVDASLLRTGAGWLGTISGVIILGLSADLENTSGTQSTKSLLTTLGIANIILGTVAFLVKSPKENDFENYMKYRIEEGKFSSNTDIVPIVAAKIYF